MRVKPAAANFAARCSSPTALGSHGKWNSWHARGAPPDDLFEVTTHQRFAAGESHLANTDSFDADSDYSNDLVGHSEDLPQRWPASLPPACNTCNEVNTSR